MMKTIFLIDSGCLRHIFKQNECSYTADGIEAFALDCMDQINEKNSLLRILFYDCLPFRGKVKSPISKTDIEHIGEDRLLGKLGQKNYFAIRYGKLKFRGWALKEESYSKNCELEDSDFNPIFEQKGVDLRIGMDISKYAHDKTIGHIILLSADTDFVPALKCARTNGIKISMLVMDKFDIHFDLKTHSDSIMVIKFPKNNANIKKWNK
ncbi:MAG: NYN domain-containing protein [Rickettsiales bacterium]|nr:NYN domain-containing protein [Rickettsiales bacterium]